MYQSELGQILQTFLRLEKSRAVETLVYTKESDAIKLAEARTTVVDMDMLLNLPDWLEKLVEKEIGKDRVIQSYSDI